MDLTQKLKDWLCEQKGIAKNADDETFRLAASQAIAEGTLSPQKLAELTAANGSKSPDPRDVFGSVRVKSPSERYSTTKSVGRHAKTGQPVRDERGREVHQPSELENAKAGALLKHLAAKSGVPGVMLSEHEEELLAETCERDLWAGFVNGDYKYGVPMSKALLDDVTSGGLELTPVWFDENLIQFPLLNGELFPFVDLVEVPRGRRIEGGSIGNPTVTWGQAEGTAISTFDTTSLAAAIDTTIFNVNVGVEIGLDFMSDSPADVGRLLTGNIGQRLLTELDRMVATGDGTTQPQGIFNASGITDIGNPSGGAGAVPQVDDYETLLFSVGKQYRNAAMRPAFIANDTTYSRARGIAVGASDERRIFGMDHQSYKLLEYPFKVQNDLSNSYAAFGCLAKYRMYRRIGQSVRFETGGKELTTKNLGLLMVRGRYGGRVVDANAFAFSDNFQA